MDDELPGGIWRIDAETRAGLRLKRVRAAIDHGEWEAAILEAEELLDEEPRHPEALFLLGEALLETADFELARAAYEQRVRLDGGDTPALLGLAIASFQTCDLPRAIENAREVARRTPDNAEAHYYLGLALERLPGRAAEALTSLSAASHLDPERFPLPMQLDDEDWQHLVGAAVMRLHPRLRAFYSELQFRLEDLPSLVELQSHEPPLPPTIGALYKGEPPDLDTEDPWEHRPEAIRLFARNLARAPSTESLLERLTHALQEEALDWLGVSLDDL
jgi:tetratricopeptide (TPR) repeat protein